MFHPSFPGRLDGGHASGAVRPRQHLAIFSGHRCQQGQQRKHGKHGNHTAAGFSDGV